MAVTPESIKSRIQLLMTQKSQLTQRNEKNERILQELEATNNELAEVKKMVEKQYKDLFPRIPVAEKRLTEIVRPLMEMEKKTEEYSRLSGSLIERSVIDDEKINVMDIMLREAQDFTLRAQRRYAEVSQQLLIREEMLAESEKTADLLEKKARELEREKFIAKNKLNAMKERCAASNALEKTMNEKLKLASQKISQMEERANKSELEALQRQKEMGIVADELALWRDRRNLLRYEMERMAGGMHEL